MGVNKPYASSLIQLLSLQASLAAITNTGGSGGGGTSSTIDTNTSIEYGAGNTTAKTQRVVIAANNTPTVILGAGSNTIGAISNTSFGISGTLPAFAATPTFNIGTAPNLTFTNTTFAATQSGAWIVGLSAGSNAIGSITNTSFVATQSTASSLNATVVGTGTFATQVTSLPSLPAGANAIGSITNTSFAAIQSGTWNLNNISGIISLPTGASTSAKQDSLISLLSAALTTKSTAFQSSASLTRAANTTTYAANDVIFGAFELTNVGNNGGFIFLTDIHQETNITYLPSGIGNLRLFLYSVTPPSAVADNSAFSVPSGDRASILTPAGISLGTPALANGGGSLVLNLNNINRLYKLSGTSLFGYLVTEGAWVPTANSETATITAMAIEA